MPKTSSEIDSDDKHTHPKKLWIAALEHLYQSRSQLPRQHWRLQLDKCFVKLKIDKWYNKF